MNSIRYRSLQEEKETNNNTQIAKCKSMCTWPVDNDEVVWFALTSQKNKLRATLWS